MVRLFSIFTKLYQYLLTHYNRRERLKSLYELLSCRIMFFKGFNRRKFHLHVGRQNLKILLIINYVLLLSVLFIALINPPVTGYEFSIYDAYPGYFWCLIISSIFLGQVCAVLSALDDSTSKYWILGFLAAAIATCLLLCLPIIRGYFIYGSGDILTHIGYMRDIENSASTGSNHYPILHIFGFTIREIAGLSFNIVTMAILPIFSIVSILYWYILGREVFDDKLKVLVLVLIAVVPMYGVVNSLFTPNHGAFLMLPLFLYGLVKSQHNSDNSKISMIMITLSVLVVLFHPLIAIMVMSIYALSYVSNKIYIVFSPLRPYTNNAWMIIAIMVMIFSIWSTYLRMFKNVLDPFILSITRAEEVESQFVAQLELVSRVDVDIIYLMKLGLFTYGLDAILGLLSLTCILYLILLFVKKEIPMPRSLLFCIVCFTVFFVLGVTIFFAMNEFGYSRVYMVARIFSLLIISSTAVTAYRRVEKRDNSQKIFFCTAVCALVTMLIVLSIFTLHLSPIIKQTNQQVPKSGYYGMDMFFEKRDDSIQILEHGVSQLRFYDAIYGRDYPGANIKYGGLLPIDHFGYNSSSSLGSNYDEERYFLLATLGREFYEHMYPEFPDKWRFIDSDFERLESDTSVIRVYSNDNLDLYFINYLGIT